MARIVCTSDLHLGITPARTLRALVGDMARARPDAVVVAGDLGEPVELFCACLDLLRPLQVPVGIVAGNHDLWTYPGGGPDSARLFGEVLPRHVRSRGFCWLEEDAIALPDGAALAGSIAWYDYSRRSPETAGWTPEQFARIKPDVINDGRRISWNHTDPGFAGLVSDRLVSRLERLSADPEVRRILVATHVPVFERQLTGRRGEDPALESYYANLTLGRRLLAFPKLAAVVSGHTHRGLEPVEVPQEGRPPVTMANLASDYGDPRFVAIEL